MVKVCWKFDPNPTKATQVIQQKLWNVDGSTDRLKTVYPTFGSVVQMLFKDMSDLELWRPFCLVEWNHLCNFGRGHHEEQFCGIVLNLGQWFRCCLKTQAFKWALLFPTFLICSYFSLLFLENALLSLLFHSKISFTRKNPEIFPPPFACSDFRNQSYFSSGSPPLKHNKN